jgi:hypothetical protein
MSEMRVRLTPDEVAERAQRLAASVRELVLLEEEIAERRKAMSLERSAAQKRVRDLAQVVATGVEDRSAQMSFE